MNFELSNRILKEFGYEGKGGVKSIIVDELQVKDDIFSISLHFCLKNGIVTIDFV